MRFLLRSPIILLFLGSVACTLDNRADKRCSGCYSAHGYSGTSPTPPSVTVSAGVSRLVLASGEDLAATHDILVAWSGDVFTLREGGTSGDAGAADGGSDDAGDLVDASVDPDASDLDADADAAPPQAVAPRAFGRIRPMTGHLSDAKTVEASSEPTVLLEVVVCTAEQELLPDDRCLDATGSVVDADRFEVLATATGFSGGYPWPKVTVRDERLVLDASEFHTPGSPGSPGGYDCY